MPATETKAETCKKCNFTWTPRVPNPRACPKCKSYLWREPRKQLKEPKNEPTADR